jgi:hypothetical protein
MILHALTANKRNFTVVSHTKDSITFSIVDPDGKEGFPGEVISYITYTVTPWQWHFKMVAFALTKKTPIMLSSHVSPSLHAYLQSFPLCHSSVVLKFNFRRTGILTPSKTKQRTISTTTLFSFPFPVSVLVLTAT